jgi:[ribosomal protein S5]-alanine N-acetyltransferase
MSERTAVPTLLTERLALRAVTEADVDAYERHFVDYEIIRYLSACVPWPYPEGGVADFIREEIVPAQGRDRWVWGLHLKENDGELIGVIDLWRQGSPEHRGFWLGRAFWGRGYMTEAVIRVTDCAFDELGFDHLVLSNAVGNRRSRDIKARTGARLVGVAPQTFVDPTYTHAQIWRLTKAEWQAWRRSGAAPPD